MSDVIDWATTGQILVESLAAGVLIVAAFALGARLISSAQDGSARPDGAAQTGLVGRYALAALCFALAAAAVGLGVYLTIDK
ncbi:hypothetical protein [uncultured Jatrophihabitans sp.]|uniref:hypothetical protein n=1 Tax=uncultured Jatrophihabitans sp. TaxID=1610747 RepID=UPI0035CA4719